MTDETKSLVHLWMQLLNQVTRDENGNVVNLLDDARRKAISDKIMIETGILKQEQFSRS